MEKDDHSTFLKSKEFSYPTEASRELASTINSTGETRPLLPFDSDNRSKPARLDRAGLVGCIVSFVAVILAAVIALIVAVSLQSANDDYDAPWSEATYARVFESYDVHYSHFLNDYVTLNYLFDPTTPAEFEGTHNMSLQATLYMLPQKLLNKTALFTFRLENAALSIVSAATVYYWLNIGSSVNVSVCSYRDVEVDLFVLKGQQNYNKWKTSGKLCYTGRVARLQSQCSPTETSPHIVNITQGTAAAEYFFLFLLPTDSPLSSGNVSAMFNFASKVYDTSNHVSKCTADRHTPNCTLSMQNYLKPVYQIEQSQSSSPSISNGPGEGLQTGVRHLSDRSSQVFVYDNGYRFKVSTTLNVYGGFIALMCALGVLVLGMAVVVAVSIACFRRRHRKRIRVSPAYTEIQ